MDCIDCPNMVICEAQNKLDMMRLDDIRLAVETMDHKNALDLINNFKIRLMKRNLRITGRD